MPVIEYNIRINRRGRPINEMIKGVYVKLGKIPFNLSYVKDTVLKATSLYINANRRRPIEEHSEKALSVNPRSKSVERYTKRNNLFNTIEAGTRIIKRDKYNYSLIIGEKRFLDAYAPYWYIVNYGGRVPPPVYGYFGKGKPPIPGMSGEVFHATGGWKGTAPGGKNSYLMIPQVPIPPMHYLNFMARTFELMMKDNFPTVKEVVQEFTGKAI